MEATSHLRLVDDTSFPWPETGELLSLADATYREIAGADEIRARGGKVSFFRGGAPLAAPAPAALLDFAR